jgi:hypothetical protein
MNARKIFVPKRTIVRASTRDHAMVNAMMTHDSNQVIDQFGNQRGRVFDHAYRTMDGRTVDSTGAFLVGELERLDQTLNMPLTSVTWSRDIDLREDVSLADEVASYTLSTFASAGSLGAGQGIRNGKAWIGKSTNQIGGVAVDIGKFPQPLTPWALEIKFSIMELESAAKLGRPIDDQKHEALKLKHQMDIDEMVYVGDSSLSVGGLVNAPGVTNVSNLPNGATTSLWSAKTPQQILDDVNATITSAWRASAWAVMPNKILLPPTQFGYISTQLISSAGNTSILKYLLENNVLKASGKGEIEFAPAKWLTGAGVGGNLGTEGTVDRMVAYTQDRKYIRYPMTMLQRTPVQYSSLYHMTVYYCKLGVVEVPYPETIAYRDGL